MMLIHKYSIIKASFAILFFFLFFIFESSSAFAASFSLNPSNGFILEDDEFILDMLIDSEGSEVVQARGVLTFDPTLVQIVEAERNNSLFAQFPSNEQSTDNTNGVLMITGFTQSGSGTPYTTSGDADVFARVTFKAIKDGAVVFDWEYSGSDEPFKSVIIEDGSPPQNILTTRPQTSTFTIENTSGDTTGTTTTGSTTGSTGTTPNTGIIDDSGVYFGLFAIFGGIMVYSGISILYRLSQTNLVRNKRTIVEYD